MPGASFPRRASRATSVTRAARTPRVRLSAVALAVALAAHAPRAAAQLRPLEPLPAAAWDTAHVLTLVAGGSLLTDQRASLAGTAGTLAELANFSLAWRSGRVVLEVAGTVARRLREDARFTAAESEVVPDADGVRADAGDLRISTAVRLTPPGAGVLGVVRFGVRLPTTDNRIGLDRDATDIFLLLGGSGRLGPLWLAGDAGLGIHGTRELRYEQEEVLLYAVRAELRGARLTPTLGAVGQMHARTHPAIRGVEDLGELRAGLRWGTRRWLHLEGVRGFTSFSPSSGVRLALGTSLR